MADPIKLIRISEFNKNIDEGLKGQWGQIGDTKYSITVLKNIVFINLYEGAKVDIKLPTVYDGFLLSSNGRRIKITNSELKCNMASDETAFGQLVLKKWN